LGGGRHFGVEVWASPWGSISEDIWMRESNPFDPGVNLFVDPSKCYSSKGDFLKDFAGIGIHS